MLIPIPIPYSTRWVAKANGTVWKVVTCSHCQQRYGFQLELETTGQVVGAPLSMDADGARQAQARAQENLAKMGRNVVIPLPCPNCGCYQPDMVEVLRSEGTSNAPVKVGLLVIVVSLIPLAFSVPYNWVATVVGVAVGFGLIGYGDWAAARWDPNAGPPEKRKALGRKRAVWGEELDELLAAGRDADVQLAAPAAEGPAPDAQIAFVFFENQAPAARVVKLQPDDAEPGAAPDSGRT